METTSLQQTMAAGRTNTPWNYLAIVLPITFAVLWIAVLLQKGSPVLFLLALAGIGFLGIIVCARRMLRARRRFQSARLCVIAFIGCGANLVVALALAGIALAGVWREMWLKANSASRLQGLSIGLYSYCEKHGSYPATLEEIVATGAFDEGCLLADGDPHAPRKAVEAGRLIYSSYVYNPGQGRCGAGCREHEDLIMFYEREPFSPGQRGNLAGLPQVRCLAFEDAHVDCLTEDEFRAAMTKDQQRRRELGWLTTQSAPNE